MSELARAVRFDIERQSALTNAGLISERDALRNERLWAVYALKGSVGFAHSNFVSRDERVPIPERKK